MLSLRTDIFSAILIISGKEKISLLSERQKADGTRTEGRSPRINNLSCRSCLSLAHLSLKNHAPTLLGANLRDPDCRSGSSEEHQHMLIFTWQQPSQGRCPFPSHHPSDDWRADSCTVLSNTHSKTPAINFSHFSPNLPSSHTLPAHFTLPYSRLKPLHILLALFQLP